MRKLSLVVICLAIVAVAGCGKKGQFVNLPPGATLDTSQPVQQQQPGFSRSNSLNHRYGLQPKRSKTKPP